jgi:hypothetical protein
MTANISGVSIRYDVPSKCTVVGHLLTKKYLSKKEQDQHIKKFAASIKVNPITIKMWCAKYATTWELGRNLPIGTMSHSFLTIPEASIPKVVNELAIIRASLIQVSIANEVSTVKEYCPEELRSRRTPKEVLELLITSKQPI